MGRHEIRLRRQKMTSRRIEAHKNYYEVLKRHERSNKMRKLMRLILALVAFILLMSVVYFVAKMVTFDNEPTIENEQISKIISRPDIVQYVSLNTNEKWKSEKTRKRT